MKNRILFAAVMLCGLAIPCAAQFQGAPPSVAAPKTPVIDEALLTTLLNEKQPAMKFRPLDVVAVTCFGLGQFSGQQRIEEDGTIRFPFLGVVQVAGLTVPELEQKITTQLKDLGIMQDPQVTVAAISQPWMIVTVAGDVQRPGAFPANSNLTLMDFLSEAGGLQDNLSASNLATNSSSSSVVTLVRPSLDKAVNIPLGPDPDHSPFAKIPLFPGDEIRVGRVGQVYAVGAFKFQGAYALKNTSPTTVLQLMAQAGGIGFEGDRKDARIIRTNGTEEFVLAVNVSKILNGKIADINLEPNDILFVPTNQMKAAIKGGGTGALVSIADAAVLSNH
jgi:polysaccharide export outer membrane protein